MTASVLLEQFETIRASWDEHTDRPAFATEPIPGGGGVLMGCSVDGYPALLIEDSLGSEAPMDLEEVRIDWGRRVQVHQGGRVREARFTIARLKQTGEDEVKAFLFVFVSVLSAPRVGESLHDLISRCVRLFRKSKERPIAKYIGVWAELLLLSLSRDVVASVMAWHSNPNERLDLAIGNERIEVKCTAGPTRAHHFSLEQLCPPEGVQSWVASFRASELSNGTNVQDLVEELLKRLGGENDAAERLLDVVSASLGHEWFGAPGKAYDRYLAVQSLRFFRVTDIPSVSLPLPAGVSQVSFTSSLDHVAEAPEIDFQGPLMSLFQEVHVGDE